MKELHNKALKMDCKCVAVFVKLDFCVYDGSFRFSGAFAATYLRANHFEVNLEYRWKTHGLQEH